MKTAKFIILLLVFSLSLGQLGRVSFSGVTLYISDFLAFLYILWSGIYFIKTEKKFYIPKVFLLVFSFCFIALVSLILSLQWLSMGNFLVSSLYLVRFTLYAVSGLILSNYIREENFSNDLIKWIILSGVLLSIFGYFQLIFLPDFSILDPSLGWDPHKNRLASTFMDPNFAGAYLVIALLLSFKKKLGDMGGFWVMRGIILIGIILTFSRSAWGMLSVCILLMLALSKIKLSHKFCVFCLVILLALAAYRLVPAVQTRISGITDPADSAQFRLTSWKNTIGFIKENPIIGVGFNTFRYAQERKGLFDITNPEGGHSGSGSDSSLLLVLATTGFLGGLAYFGGMLWVIKKSLTSMTSPELFVITVGLLLESNFINSLFYAPILLIWFLLVGVFLFKD